MNVKSDLLFAGLSDTGRARKENEDRIHIDADRGLFIVADGLGGHAAGERAAETAVDMIKTRLARQTGTAEERMREAIAVANNEIYDLAAENPEWSGMASVVTVALIENGSVVVGHVGDSRLYLLEPGTIRKLTRDHSPVGELEDSGKLSEAAAMAHPRRNEVFRDLGSERHGPHDEEFIEILEFPFQSTSALLLCSDGLSDLLPSDLIRRIVEQKARTPKTAVKALVDAANDAGGKDNVSVVLVEGPGYAAAVIPPPAQAPMPPPVRVARSSGGGFGRFIAGLLLGLVIAAGAFFALRPYFRQTADGTSIAYGNVRLPVVWKVVSGGSIADALANAEPGDTVSVAPGMYQESIRIRPGVHLVSARRREAILQGDVQADGVLGSRVTGFRIEGPAATGIRIADSDLEVTDVEVTGMHEAGIEIDAGSPTIRASTIKDNPGTGIVVKGAARPVIINNVIARNGSAANHPGLHITGTAAPVVTGNVIEDNDAEQVWVSPLANVEQLLQANVIAPGSKHPKTEIKVVTR